MNIRYDFHLHSCLSPCGDREMTPYNLVQMAGILELEAIALTDHNTVGNCRSAMAVGEEIGLTVLPGMELCTSEEIHVVCLFPGLEAAEAFGREVYATLPPVKNKAHIFGEQLFMDAQDQVTGSEELLLVTASGISIDEVGALCGGYGGFCYPAHIDRSSYSLLSVFGMIPPHLGFACMELTPGADLEALKRDHPLLSQARVMRSSDAHYLENMSEAADTLEVEHNTPEAIIEALKGITQ